MFASAARAAVVTAMGIAVAGPGVAMPTSITDTTAGTATNDGTIGGGEYVGSSLGINSGFGNVIGDLSELFIDSDTGGAVNLGLRTGGGGLFDAVVIYLDVTPGGFGDTTPFDDIADGLRRAISATDGTNRSDITFAPGFEADYAIGIEQNFAGVWSLVGGGSHTFLTSANLTPTGNPSAGEFEIDFDLSTIGLSPGDSFDYVVTYLNSGNAFRSDEFHGVASSTVPPGNPGQNPTTLASGDFNTFTSVAPSDGVRAPAMAPVTVLLVTGAMGLAARRRLRRR